MDKNETEAQWRVDKHVPLALLFAIAVQTLGAFWWAAGVSFRINDLEQRMNNASSNADRLTRLEASSEFVKETLKEIKALLSPQHR